MSTTNAPTKTAYTAFVAVFESCPECSALGEFPCWPCVRAGRREVPE